jgi:hypothetical protein
MSKCFIAFEDTPLTHCPTKLIKIGLLLEEDKSARERKRNLHLLFNTILQASLRTKPFG